MLSPNAHIALVVLPAAIFFACVCGIIVAISVANRDLNLARAGPNKAWSNQEVVYQEPFDGSRADSWIPPYPTLDVPEPLLYLALQRVAAKAGKHLERPENVRIVETYQESTGSVETDADPGVDRWYRWTVVACFYSPDENHGMCEKLDVRTKTAWKSGVPPTEWPVEVISLGIEDPTGAPPSTSDLLLVTGKTTNSELQTFPALDLDVNKKN